MNRVIITEKNIKRFEHLSSRDAAEEISREAVHGIALCGETDDEPVALTIWEYRNRTSDEGAESELLDIWLKDSAYAKDLFEAYDEEIRGENVRCTSFEFPLGDGNLKTALESAGFAVEERESRDILVTIRDFEECHLLKYEDETDGEIMALDDLISFAYRRGLEKCLRIGRRGLPDDLEALPIWRYDENVSCALMKDGKVRGLLLIKRRPSDIFIVEYFHVLGESAGGNAFALARNAVINGSNIYPEDSRIILRRHDRVSKALIQMLFPGRRGEMVYEAGK